MRFKNEGPLSDGADSGAEYENSDNLPCSILLQILQAVDTDRFDELMAGLTPTEQVVHLRAINFALAHELASYRLRDALCR